MSSCEKCWGEAGGDADQYAKLVQRQPACTPEQQAGRDAADCEICNRKTRHQFTGECMACGDHPRMRAVLAERARRQEGAPL